MRISIGKITNAWVLAIELQEEVREYAYSDKKTLIAHVQRLLDSIQKEEQENQDL